MTSGLVKVDNYVDRRIRTVKRLYNKHGSFSQYQRLQELQKLRKFLDRLFGRCD